MQNNSLNIIELVRSIQRSAGEPDCFRRDQSDCDKLDCTWRSLCLQTVVNSTLTSMGVNNNN